MGGGKEKKKSSSQRGSQEKGKTKDNSKPIKDTTDPYDGLEDEIEELDITDSDTEPEVKPKSKGKENNCPMEPTIDSTTAGGGSDGMPLEEKKMSRKEMKKQKKKVCCTHLRKEMSALPTCSILNYLEKC